jgi:hypothetical protein
MLLHSSSVQRAGSTEGDENCGLAFPMDHSEEALWSEDPARELNNEISELQARVAFPQHWSSGEHEQHVERLRQLNDQKRQLEDYSEK